MVLIVLAGILRPIPAQPVSGDPERSDAALYTAIASGIGKGQPYYPTFEMELRSRGYPTSSVFNWRQPLLLEVYAAAPRACTLVLLALGVASVIGNVWLLRNQQPEATVLGLILQVGAASSVVIVHGAATVPEVWLGYLLFASVLAYAHGANRIGATTALAGLFIRELAAPYCVACVILALRRRKYSELRVWAAGAAAYAVYFGCHVTSVIASRGPDPVPQHGSWLQFGGLPFVLGTLSFNGWFAASQPWGPALGCALVLASVWARGAPLHLRLCSITFLGFFSVAGQSFNQNWGLVAAPAWALACGYGVIGVKRLIRQGTHTTNA